MTASGKNSVIEKAEAVPRREDRFSRNQPSEPGETSFPEVMTAYAIDRSCAEQLLSDVLTLAAAALNATLAIAYIQSADRQWLELRVDCEAKAVAELPSIVRQCIEQRETIFVPDLDSGLNSEGAIAAGGPADCRFAAAQPFLTPEGHALGALLLLDALPRPEGLAEQEHRLLRAAAAQALAQLEVRRQRLAREESERQRDDALEQYRQFMSANPQMLWVANADRKIVEISPRWLEFTGRSADQILGQSWLEHIHPDDRSAVIKAITGAELTLDVKYRTRIASGEYRWVRVRGWAQIGEAGDVVRWFGVAEDIHDHEAAIAALKESEEHHRYSVELNPQIPWTATADGRIREVGSHWLEDMGFNRSAMLDYGWFKLLHPADRPRTIDAWRQSIDTGEPFDIEYRLRMPDGGYRWFRGRAAPRRDEHGNIVRWYGTTENIHDRKTAEAALRESEEHHRYTVELSPQIPWVATPDGAIIEVSQRWFALMQADPERKPGSWVHVVHPDDRGRIENLWRRSLATGEPYDAEYRLHTSDGTYRWFRSRAAARRDEQGNIIRWYGTLEDIHDRKEAEQALRESEERFRLAARAAGLGIYDYDVKTGRADWSDEIKEMLGLPPDAEPDTSLIFNLIHPEDRPVLEQLIGSVSRRELEGRFGETLRVRRADNGETRWLAADGWESHSEDGQLSRVLITVRDVTSERTAAERISWAASHDPLTGLANRLRFQMQLGEAIGQAETEGGRVGVLLVDMGSLKQINDHFGHATGDVLLRDFAGRLSETVGSEGTVARLGGDEFAISLSLPPGSDGLGDVIDRLLANLRRPVLHGEHSLEFRASIGASLYPDHGKDASALLSEADIALHRAKEAGRNRAVLFEPVMRSELQRRESALNLTRTALREDGIVPYYQPKIDLKTGKLFGFEALLRWRHPHKGIQPPGAIAAAFEDHELAVKLSERMMSKIVADMRRWLDQGLNFGHVAVNASAAEFRHEGFAERMLAHLQAADLDPSFFELEVTESVLLESGGQTVEHTLRSLNGAGMPIALDDFGTGYASLAHLKLFPVNTLKIDRSFVLNLEVNHSDAAIVRAILSLGQSLGIRVVAEGIESEAHADFLKSHGCDFGQGYFYGRPSPADEVIRFMLPETQVPG